MSDDYPKKRGSHSSTSTGYSVEAREDGREPKQYGDQIFDNRWREVAFKSNTVIGIPRCGLHRKELEQHGLFNYSAAQALRWWFHANADAEPLGSLCLETRIVKHEIKIEGSCVAVSDHKLITGEDRSNILPDWGKKTPKDK